MKQLNSTHLAKVVKERAIILALLLHLLIAAIVYFTVFYKEPLVTTDEYLPAIPMIQYQESAVSIKEDLPVKESQSLTATAKDEANNDKINIISLKKTITKENLNAAKSKSQKSSKIAMQTSRPTKARKAETEEQNLPQSLMVESSSEKATLNPTSQNNSSSDYQLNKTREYDVLEAEIEKDSEQLSQLIAEVKKRNQSQIQRHHTPQPDLQASTQNPILSDNTLPVQSYDSFTSTTSLPDTQTSVWPNPSKNPIEPVEAIK